MERLASSYYDKMIANLAPSLKKFRATVKQFASNLSNSSNNATSEMVTFEEFLVVLLVKRKTSGEFLTVLNWTHQ